MDENRIEEDEILEQTDSTSVTPTSTKSKTEAPAWKEFQKIPGDNFKDGRLRALCIHCKKHQYVADSKTGTTNMNRHLKVCMKRPREESAEGSFKIIDPEAYHEKLAEIVILNGYPFLWAENKGDRSLHYFLNGSVRFICRNTMKAKCLKLNEKHFGIMKSFIESLPGKVCLTTDLWTSCVTEGYLCLTASCIDSNWKLSSRILNFRHVPPPHCATDLCEFIHKLLKEWGIERKVLSITMDNASNMDKLHSMLETRLNPSGGKLFHIRCCAHILNLIVQAGLEYIGPAVKNVRESVKYVKAGEGRMIKFKECAELVEVSTKKGLWLDVVTRWNSTFQMIDRALLYRPAFERLKVVDKYYTTLPSPAEWDRIHQIHKILKPFDTITNLFSGSDYPTSNLYFENVWKIQMRLLEASNSSDQGLKQMLAEMIEKFNKYWGEYSHVLSFGAILDPRYKLNFVSVRFKKLNEEVKVVVIKDQLEKMFKEYANKSGVISQVRREAASRDFQEADGADDLSDCFLDVDDSSSERTELDLYLDEPRVQSDSDFDILGYWKENQARFPVLSTMARDILSIPITTVASESSFSIGGRVLNKWRSRLLPENVEALITTRNWLHGYEAYADDDSENDNNAGVQINIVEQPQVVQPSTSHVWQQSELGLYHLAKWHSAKCSTGRTSTTI